MDNGGIHADYRGVVVEAAFAPFPADEADYHEDTGEIEARGNVQMNYRDDPSGARAGNVRIRLEKIYSK